MNFFFFFVNLTFLFPFRESSVFWPGSHNVGLLCSLPILLLIWTIRSKPERSKSCRWIQFLFTALDFFFFLDFILQHYCDTNWHNCCITDCEKLIYLLWSVQLVVYIFKRNLIKIVGGEIESPREPLYPWDSWVLISWLVIYGNKSVATK